jgi:hypothetical protein
MPRNSQRVSSRSGLQPEEAFWRDLDEAKSQRNAPRVHANVRVRLKAKGASTLKVRSNDVSFQGMQVLCDRETAEILRAQSKNSGTKAILAASLDLDVNGISLRVKVHARIAHITLDPQAPPDSAVAIGMAFVNYQDGAQHALYQFVVQHMRPVTP